MDKKVAILMHKPLALLYTELVARAEWDVVTSAEEASVIIADRFQDIIELCNKYSTIPIIYIAFVQDRIQGIPNVYGSSLTNFQEVLTILSDMLESNTQPVRPRQIIRRDAVPKVVLVYDPLESLFTSMLPEFTDWSVVSLVPSEEDPEPVVEGITPDMVICTIPEYLSIAKRFYPLDIPFVYVGYGVTEEATASINRKQPIRKTIMELESVFEKYQ